MSGLANLVTLNGISGLPKDDAPPAADSAEQEDEGVASGSDSSAKEFS